MPKLIFADESVFIKNNYFYLSHLNRYSNFWMHFQHFRDASLFFLRDIIVRDVKYRKCRCEITVRMVEWKEQKKEMRCYFVFK